MAFQEVYLCLCDWNFDNFAIQEWNDLDQFLYLRLYFFIAFYSLFSVVFHAKLYIGCVLSVLFLEGVCQGE